MKLAITHCLCPMFALILLSTFPQGSHCWEAGGVDLCTAPPHRDTPTVASDGCGGAIVCFADSRNGGTTSIYAQRVGPSGTLIWGGDCIEIRTGTTHSAYPTIVADGAGGAIITWQDYRSGTNYDIYAQRVTASGEVQWTTNGVPLCTESHDQTFPHIASDGAGGAIVAWIDTRYVVIPSAGNDILAQRVDAAGVIQWAPDGEVMSAEPGDQQWSYYDLKAHRSQIVSDGAGGAILVWEDDRDDDYGDIFAQRVDASGDLQWGFSGVAICTNPEPQYRPAIVPDGVGGAIICWVDNRVYPMALYAQRVDASGVVQWTADGAFIWADDYFAYNPTMISDTASVGAIIAWEGGSNPEGPAIYAQLVDGSGAIQWGADGVRLYSGITGTDPSYPAIASDGSGGALVTWLDTMFGDATAYERIYAQRVSASGAVQWNADGVPIKTKDFIQGRYAGIVPDASGGAIVTWGQLHSDSEIYAQRITHDGVVMGNMVPLLTLTIVGIAAALAMIGLRRLGARSCTS